MAPINLSYFGCPRLNVASTCSYVVSPFFLIVNSPPGFAFHFSFLFSFFFFQCESFSVPWISFWFFVIPSFFARQ